MALGAADLVDRKCVNLTDLFPLASLLPIVSQFSPVPHFHAHAFHSSFPTWITTKASQLVPLPLVLPYSTHFL